MEACYVAPADKTPEAKKRRLANKSKAIRRFLARERERAVHDGEEKKTEDDDPMENKALVEPRIACPAPSAERQRCARAGMNNDEREQARERNTASRATIRRAQRASIPEASGVCPLLTFD